MAMLTDQRTNVATSFTKGSPFGYWVMVAFSFLYYFRPGDIIPGLSVLHMARITSVIAILALLLGTKRTRPKNLPVEVKIILAMYAWMILCVPFSSWRTGSALLVFFEVSKIVMISLALTLTVTTLAELRRLLAVQALGVGLMTIAAVVVNNRMQGRLAGVGDALLANPNDLAMNVSLNWPFCLVFLLTARGIVRKIFWIVTMLVMVYALMATYSRAGFMALAVVIVFCLWDFGIRGRRGYMLAIAAGCLLGVIVVAPGNYIKRLETLVGRFQEGDYDRGSAEARRELLVKSLTVTATHPVFGVGPGNFPSFTGLWRVTHNTYTQLSSECGIPALLLFLFLLRRAYLNLRYLRKLPFSRETNEVHLYTNALTASFAAYLLGAFFSSSAYELFPYYIVVYTTLLYKLEFKEPEPKSVKTFRTAIEIRPRVYNPS